MAGTTTTACPFFDTLPAELRLNIYGLAFTPANDKDDVDLFTAEPPTKSLLLTCRKAYVEARTTYQRAYRRYWTSTKFKSQIPESDVASDVTRRGIRAKINALREQDLQPVENLKILVHRGFEVDQTIDATLLDRRGGRKYVFDYCYGSTFTEYCALSGDDLVFDDEDEMKRKLLGMKDLDMVPMIDQISSLLSW